VVNFFRSRFIIKPGLYGPVISNDAILTSRRLRAAFHG
jgi:hypothetical protein